MREQWSTLDFVVIDVEGNGQHPPDLVELALVPVTGGTIGEPMSWLVRPPAPITWQARKVHGIRMDDLVAQPGFAEVADEVQRHLGEAIPVGHSVKVDLRVMDRHLPQWHPTEAIDTLRMARTTLKLPSHKLGTLVEHRQLGTGMPERLHPHRAAYDALVTARLLVDLAEHSGEQPWTVEELRRRGGVAWAGPKPQLGLFG